MERRPPPQGVVREATPGDWEAYRAFRLRALRSDPQAFGSTLAAEEAFTPELWKERLEGESKETPLRTWVMVDGDQRILGSIVTQTEPEHSHVFGMWVAPECRNGGIGGRLLDRALDGIRSADSGADTFLEVNPGHPYAVRLFSSRGFQFTGVTRPIGHTPRVSVSEMVLTGAGSRDPPTRT